MEKLHLDILDQERKVIFQKLGTFRSRGFLAGGTALALQLGHRVSYDFDIFCSKEIPQNFPAKIEKDIYVKEVLVSSGDEFTFLTEHDIKISFIYYPFDLEKYLLDFSEAPLRLISPFGTALTKAYALKSKEIGIYLVTNKVAFSEKDVNTVLLTGFFHAYGPVNDYLK